jgi:hypothetical protein
VLQTRIVREEACISSSLVIAIDVLLDETGCPDLRLELNSVDWLIEKALKLRDGAGA